MIYYTTTARKAAMEKFILPESKHLGMNNSSNIIINEPAWGTNGETSSQIILINVVATSWILMIIKIIILNQK